MTQIVQLPLNLVPSQEMINHHELEGRALAIEEYSSTHGFMTVTPINEPGAAQVLASQMHIFQRHASLIQYICVRSGIICKTPIFTFSLMGFQTPPLNAKCWCKLYWCRFYINHSGSTC